MKQMCNFKMMRFLCFVTLFVFCNCDFLGCYKNGYMNHPFKREGNILIDDCITICKNNYYRYASRNESLCVCVNILGELLNSTVDCERFCSNCDTKFELIDVYSTGNLVPGPPKNIKVENISDTGAHVSWEEPESHLDITFYKIKAIILHTYSKYSPISPEWMFSNNTFRTELITLLPATKYNITIRALSEDGEGAEIFKMIRTDLGEPDAPEHPEEIQRDGKTVTVKFTATDNNGGPISAYQIIVVNDDAKQAIQRDNIKGYHEAIREGQNYYIAAELDPQNIEDEFTVGDGKYYRGFYNAALEPNVNYRVILGLVSRLNDTVKISYSDPSVWKSDILVLDVNTNTNTSTTVIFLSVAIAIFGCIFIAGLIGFVIIKKRFENRRQRLTDNQELTIQGPMIEIENSGYIPDDERIQVNHYQNLKQKVRTIPYSSLKIDYNDVLGYGKYGHVNPAHLQENNTALPVMVYNIPDRKLSHDAKRSMLKDLDLIIQTEKHENILYFFGTSETSALVCVIFEYTQLNLKEVLLSSRTPTGNYFSSRSENQILEITTGIVAGMRHLEKLKIVHKQLCARNIFVTSDFTPKIGGYGLSHLCKYNKNPDYTRWTAMEIFRGFPYSNKSDVWSFACLFWEICSLGGTPYGNVGSSEEVTGKVLKGTRLPQLGYMSDELYQLMLNCWQLDYDERPNFLELFDEIYSLKNNFNEGHLNFNLFTGFQYEEYFQEFEVPSHTEFSIN